MKKSFLEQTVIENSGTVKVEFTVLGSRMPSVDYPSESGLKAIYEDMENI